LYEGLPCKVLESGEKLFVMVHIHSTLTND